MKTNQYKTDIRPDGSLEIQTLQGVPVAVLCLGEKIQDIATLFASAPNLLEALELAEATLQRLAPDGSRATQGTRDVISAALAKARGTATESEVGK